MSSARGGDTAQVIWLSDLHFISDGLVQGHDPRARLDAAIDHINTHYPDADCCVITGDMVDLATPDIYADLRRRLDRLTVPSIGLTGNHDARGLFLDHMPLPPTAQPGFAQYALDVPGARLICLDTLWEGQDAGFMCPARLEWLSAELRDHPDTPTLIFMHHPPVDLGLPMLDPDRLSNGDALLDVLAQFPQVRQICCGHVHRPVITGARGIPLASIRAVLYQAPPPVPAWDWDSFQPPVEAPDMGIITIAADQITIQFAEFCAAEYGLGTS